MLNIRRVGPAAPPPDAAQAAVPMRDGARLAADVYLADGGAPGPAVLVRLPYDKDGAYCFMPAVARRMTARGYHVVVQDVRGKYRSEGAAEFAVHEAGDGRDTIEWIAGRPWCDGDVVMWGDSYFGYTALAAASAGHPALRAIAPRLTGSQLSTVLDHGDGTADVEQTSRKAYFATHYVDAGRYEWQPDWTARPLRAAFDAFFAQTGTRSANFDAEFEDGPGAGRFRPRPLQALLDAPPVPVLYTIGWFDNCAVWSWHDVRALAQDARWAPHLYLRMEPIDHENYHLADAPIAPADDHTANGAALARLLPRYLDPALEFFDAVLGRSGDLAALPRVRYEICHGDRREAASWPPPGTPGRTYHLAASPSPHLAEAPEPRASRVEWVHDPSDLVPSAAADPFAALFDRSDLSGIAERADVVRFLAPAAGADTDLVGAAVLLLRLTAPAGAAVHARLLDVDAAGAARLIAKGQVRVAGAAENAEVALDLQSVAYRLRAGHRLALDLMSSDFPDHVPESPAGTDPWTALPGAPSPRSVAVGGAGASRLVIGARPPGR
ncbi:CocE/NonD family hydrolase [Actinomadura parmotrematis]|uniref:CocE/NonD family hydrolase n=1 Tax=Actinomadura parmotrematis TaxID=2864039 RepID=A0ABS7FLW2_9ACTN|nr:CocE/NonD family hydrolase [Actinomadura parmotrematis]MBW8481225.1 CocE/NonD family hydrolase [Actinomadura parmotrematis]